MSSLRSANVARLGGPVFDVLVVGGGINGAVSAACLAARGARVGADRPGGLRRDDEPGVVQPGLGRHQVHGVVRVRARAKALSVAQPPDPQLPLDGAGDPLLRRAHPGLPARAAGSWSSGRGSTGSSETSSPGRRAACRAPTIAREEPIIELSGCDGGFEYSDAYLHDNDARFVWNFVRARARLRLRRRQLRRVARVQARRRRRVDHRARDVVGRRATSRFARASWSTRAGPSSTRMNALTGSRRRPPARLLEGYPPHRRPPHAATGGCSRSSRTTGASSSSSPWARAPASARPTRASRPPHAHVTDEDRRFVLDNINKRLQLPASAHREGRDRRALRRPPARRRRRRRGPQDGRLDAALAQARRRGRRAARGTSASSAASSPTA